MTNSKTPMELVEKLQGAGFKINDLGNLLAQINDNSFPPSPQTGMKTDFSRLMTLLVKNNPDFLGFIKKMNDTSLSKNIRLGYMGVLLLNLDNELNTLYSGTQPS